MSLQPGLKLGPYEILAQIGAGGMGEVYKASDTRLNRTVAIKVLPSHWADNAEMKQRFEREAQTIAALNHPHICTLYDIGRQDGVDFLVMEYLQGESLAERIARGPLPLDEALKVGVAIADALDKAQAQGVTHRDLKPGNIMLTESGAKLLDFGLAKLKQQPQAAAATAAVPTNVSATAPGTILGTMQYMAPEQLEGQEADGRTDIFAFGAVLYEMLTGKKAFAGKSQAVLIASIVSSEPEPLSKLQPTSPRALEYVVKRCLAKDPEQRMQTAWDLMCQLQWIADGGADAGIVSPVAAPRRSSGVIARVALAIVAVLIAILVVPAFRYIRGSQAELDNHFLVSVPDMPTPEAVTISPDGRWLAYSGRDSSSTAVYARPTNSIVPQKLPGTEGAGRLFWSPDSKSIAFFAGGKIKKVEAAGGPPQVICDTADLLGGSWNSEGLILFASSKGLQRVPAVGGEPVVVAAPDQSQKTGAPQEPYFLPDGRHYLFLAGSGQASGGAIYVGSLDSKETSRLVSTQSNAVYAEPGYLLYHREGTLYAQPFSAKKLALSGDAVRLADKIPYSNTGAAAFAASQTGVLIYRNTPQPSSTPGGPTASSISGQPLLWVDQSGAKVEQAGAPAGWAGLDLSPDGKRVAIHRHDANGGDIWLFEAGKDTPSPLTFDASQDNSSPVWSPDGKRVAFGSRRNGKWGLYVKSADNTGTEDLLFESENVKMPMSWSGNSLVYWASDPRTAGDIWILPLAGEKKPTAFLQTPADERNPQVSPDGKWIAYSSNESGRSEVYIKPFPDGPAKWQISVNGGLFPRWRRDGKQLYFLSLVAVGNLMASDIHIAGSSIQRDVPHALFQTGFVTGAHTGGIYNGYGASATGQRFLIPQPENLGAAINGRGGAAFALGEILTAVTQDRHATAGPSSSAPINVVLNWTAMLRKK